MEKRLRYRVEVRIETCDPQEIVVRLRDLATSMEVAGKIAEFGSGGGSPFSSSTHVIFRQWMHPREEPLSDEELASLRRLITHHGKPL